MKYFTLNRLAAVLFAEEIVMNSKIDLQSIMITKRWPYGGYFVSIVTGTSSEDIVKAKATYFSLRPTNI